MYGNSWLTDSNDALDTLAAAAELTTRRKTQDREMTDYDLSWNEVEDGYFGEVFLQNMDPETADWLRNIE